jgi:hypothetical protein
MGYKKSASCFEQHTCTKQRRIKKGQFNMASTLQRTENNGSF